MQGDIYNPISGAIDINVVDVGGYFTGTDVETVLQEVGATAAAENLWDRAGTLLTPHNAGDDVQVDGHVAIGADASVSAITLLDLDETLTFVDTTGYGIFADLYLEPTGALSVATHMVAMDMQSQWNGAVDGSVHGSVQGIKGEGVNRAAGVNHINQLIGVYGKASNLGESDVTEAIAGLFNVTNDIGLGSDIGDITSAYSVLARSTINKLTGVVTDRYGLYVEDATGAGLLTNQYGIYCEALAAAGTDNLFIKNISANSDFGSGDITTTGALDMASLVVDVNTLVVNIAGYTDKVGINTVTPIVELDVNGEARFVGSLTCNSGCTISAGQLLTDTVNTWSSGGITSDDNWNISKADPEHRMTDSGNSEYTRITLSDTDNKVIRYNRVGYNALNVNTKLLLHCDGTNGGTTFTDASTSVHTVTANGNANTSTAEQKFGTAAYAGDGTTDYLSIPNHADFDLGSGDFTIDLWYYPTSVTGNRGILTKRTSSGDYEYLIIYSIGTSLRLYASSNSSSWDIASAKVIGTLTNNTWQHIAVTRSGNNWYMFLGGTLSGNEFSNASALSIGAQDLIIGADAGSATSVAGYIDEVRIVKGTAIWTSNFTPPTVAYGTASNAEVEVWKSEDGTSLKGIQTFGDVGGETIVTGGLIKMAGASGTATFTNTGGLTLEDDLRIPALKKLYLGNNTYLSELAEGEIGFISSGVEHFRVGNQNSSMVNFGVSDNYWYMAGASGDASFGWDTTPATDVFRYVLKTPRVIEILDNPASADDYSTGVSTNPKIKLHSSVRAATRTTSWMSFECDQTDACYTRGEGKHKFDADISIPATKKLYFDGGGNTYITEGSADTMDFWATGTKPMTISTNQVVMRQALKVYDYPHAYMAFGNSQDVQIMFHTTPAVDIFRTTFGTPYTWELMTNPQQADDYGTAAAAGGNFTLKLFSATRAGTATNQWVAKCHDQTDACYTRGTGVHKFDATIDIFSTTDPQLRLTHTNGIDETDFYTNSDGELEIMPTARTIYLGDGTAGDATFGFYGATSVYTLIHDDSAGTLAVSANDATNKTVFAADGIMTMEGTARVTSHADIDAAQMKVTGGSHGEAGAMAYVSFTNNQDDEAYFTTRVPYRRAAGTDMLVVLRWYYTGGNDNTTCEWNLSYNSITAGGDPTASTALAEQAVAIATADTLGEVTFTIPTAALTADDDLGIKIWRDGSDALTAAALLVSAHVHFTMDKLGNPT